MEELDQCVALEQQIWGYPDRELVPRNMFVLAQALGGHVLGAWDEEGSLAGFAMAIAAHQAFWANSQAQQAPPTPYLHSHMLAVAPVYRNQGLGVALKLAQRDEALARGISVMRWTFDPLVAKNAFLNLRRLRAAAVQYLPDFYGPLPSGLQGGLPSDRLLIEWHLTHVAAPRSHGELHAEIPRERHLLALPAAIDRWRAEGDRAALASAQQSLRRQFAEAFAAGLRVYDFLPGSDGGGAYVLLPVSSSEYEAPANPATRKQ